MLLRPAHTPRYMRHQRKNLIVLFSRRIDDDTCSIILCLSGALPAQLRFQALCCLSLKHRAVLLSIYPRLTAPALFFQASFTRNL